MAYAGVKAKADTRLAAVVDFYGPTDMVRIVDKSKSADSASANTIDYVIKMLGGPPGDNKSKAARLLGLTRGQLRSRIEKHGLTMVS